METSLPCCRPSTAITTHEFLVFLRSLYFLRITTLTQRFTAFYVLLPMSSSNLVRFGIVRPRSLNLYFPPAISTPISAHLKYLLVALIITSSHHLSAFRPLTHPALRHDTIPLTHSFPCHPSLLNASARTMKSLVPQRC